MGSKFAPASFTGKLSNFHIMLPVSCIQIMTINKDPSRFDFGPKENLRRYGQFFPPEWHPENVTVPLSLYWGPNDWFTADKVRHEEHTNCSGKICRIQ